MMKKWMLSGFLALLVAPTLAAPVDITGTYSGKNRFAMFEKMKNGDVRFYISGSAGGNSYPCNLGDQAPSFLKMTGDLGVYKDSETSLSVEFGNRTARIVIEKANCLLGGDLKKTGGRRMVDWDFNSGD